MKTLTKYRTYHTDCPEEFKALWMEEWDAVYQGYYRLIEKASSVEDTERRRRIQQYLIDRSDREWGEDMAGCLEMSWLMGVDMNSH